MARLKEKYLNEVVPGLQEQFKYTNVMAIPKLDKVVINIGLGEAVQNPKALDAALNDLTLITGQKPVVTRAKKSIAGFKLREGMPVGVKVTLFILFSAVLNSATLLVLALSMIFWIVFGILMKIT